MKKLVVSIICSVIVASGSRIALADSSAPPSISPHEMTVTQLVGQFSSIYGIPQSVLVHTIECESGMNPKAHHVGKREDDYGLVQINLLAWKSVSVEQAESPEFAISFLARNIKAGNAPTMWVTCYRPLVKVD